MHLNSKSLIYVVISGTIACYGCHKHLKHHAPSTTLSMTKAHPSTSQEKARETKTETKRMQNEKIKRSFPNQFIPNKIHKKERSASNAKKARDDKLPHQLLKKKKWIAFEKNIFLNEAKRNKSMQKGRFHGWSVTSRINHPAFHNVQSELNNLECTKAQDTMRYPWISTEMHQFVNSRLGQCFDEKKDYKTAVMFFRKAQQNNSFLSNPLRYWTGSSLLKDGQLDEAREEFREIPKESHLFRKAQKRIVNHLLLIQGNPTEAQKTINEAALEHDPEIWWWMTQTLQRIATPESQARAVKIMRKILVKKPFSEGSETILRWQKEGKIPIIRLSIQEKMERARKLYRRYAYFPALNLLKNIPVKRVSKSSRCAFHYVRGLSWLRCRTSTFGRCRSYQRAIKELYHATQTCKNNRYHAVRAYYWLGHAYQRSGKKTLAMQTWKTLVKRFHSHFLADDVLLLIANLKRSLGDTTGANRDIHTLLQTFPKGDMVPKVYWNVGWRAYRREKWAKASDAFRQLVSHYPRNYYTPGAFYFLIRATQKRRGAKEKVETLYETLIKRYPFHYYSFLAKNRLRQLRPDARDESLNERATSPFSIKTLLASFEGKKAPFVSLKSYQEGASLLRIGRFKEAFETWKHIDFCQEKTRRCQRYGDHGIEFKALHFHLAKQYRLVNQMYRRRGRLAGNIPFSNRQSTHWYLAYPRPYWGKVKNFAQQDQLAPLVAYSIMREESAFDPNCSSTAKAYGLMQMIFPTALSTFRTKPPPLPTLDALKIRDLFLPKIILRLGVRHLRDLDRQFHHHLPLMFAAYNAGAKWTKRWIERSPELPLDEWVESIGFRETRRYVKRVFQSFGIYLFLYGDKQIRRYGTKVLSFQPWWKPSQILNTRQ